MAKKNHDSNIGLVGAILVIGGIGILVSKIKEYPFYFVMGAAGIIALASGCWYLYLKFIKEKAGNGASPLLLNLSKWISIVFCAVLLFVGIGLSTGLIKNNSATQQEQSQEQNKIADKSERLNVDTSLFSQMGTTQSIDVFKNNDHMTIVIYYPSGADDAISLLNTLDSTYFFLQTDVLNGINTVNVISMNGAREICTIAVNMSEFEAPSTDGKTFIETLMAASEVTTNKEEIEKIRKDNGWW